MSERKTAGELSLKASSDSVKYDLLEVGYALTEGVMEQLLICAERHDKIFDETEYCLILVVAGDPLIPNGRRHKYTAFPYLPQPRPQQSVYLWNKVKQQVTKRLWALPGAKTMAVISEMGYVSQEWRETKGWCDAFYGYKFFEHIRKQHEIFLPSESEYLESNREKLEKACEMIRLNTHSEKLIESINEDCHPLIPKSFDFSKVTSNKVIDPDVTLSNK